MKIGICYNVNTNLVKESDKEKLKEFVLSQYEEVRSALKQCGYELHIIGDAESLKKELSNHQIRYSFIFGISDPSGSVRIPKICDYFLVDYVGSREQTHSLTIDRALTKVLAGRSNARVGVSKHIVASKENPLPESPTFEGAWLVRPRFRGSSVNTDGRSVCVEWKDVLSKAEQYIQQDTEVIVEEYFLGRTVFVPIVGNGESVQAFGTYTYASENEENTILYDEDAPERKISVRKTTGFSYPSEVKQRLFKCCEDLYRDFMLRDYASMTFRITDDGDIYLLDVNSTPSLAREDSFTRCALISKQYHEIIGMIVAAAANRLGYTDGIPVLSEPEPAPEPMQKPEQKNPGFLRRMFF